MVQIIKASGEEEKFRKNKILRTVLKAGASRELAKQIANRIEKKARRGMTTKQILDLALKLLKKQPEIAARYDLKRAIMSLGPSGFPFEEYFSQILENYGFETKTGIIMKGKATTHEVDVLARKKLSYMIENKYHNRLGNHTNSKVAMYTYARFLDLKNNTKNKLDKGWLVTNTKCTPHSIEYSKGVGLKITSWQYASGGKNLQRLIEDKGLYPITIFKTISENIKHHLFRAKIVLAKDLADHEVHELMKKTDLSKSTIIKILEEAKKICSGR